MKHERICTWAAWAFLATALLAAPTLWAEVYSWTDENGVTHYSQTPPPDGRDARIEDVPETAEEAAVNGAGIDFDGNSESTDNFSSGELNAADQRRRELAERHDRQRALAAEQEAACRETRARLAKIEPNRRVYYTNDAGETVRMDDDERVAEVEELRAFLSANCN